MSLWINYKKYVNEVVMTNDNEDHEKISYWRNAVFCNILTYLTPLSVIALIPGVYMSFINALPIVGFIDLLIFLLMVIITLIRGIKLQIRKTIFIISLYCLSIVLLCFLPLPGPSLIFLLSITIFTSLIFSSNVAYYSALTNTLICALFSLLIYFQIAVPVSASYNLGAWIAISSNLLFLCFSCAKCLDLLLKGLTKSLDSSKIAQKKSEKSNRLHRFMCQINQCIVQTTDEEILFQKSCAIAHTVGRFNMAWIGKYDVESKKIVLLNQSGIPENSNSLFSEIYEANGPHVHVLQTGSYYVCNNIENDLEWNKWKSFASFKEIQSYIILPIKKEGITIGSFNVYSNQKNFFDLDEIELLHEATDDISFALEVFEKERRRKHSEEIIANNEKRFSALIENSEDMKTLATFDGKLFYASPAISKFLGYTIDGFLNTPVTEMIHPNDLQGVLDNMQNIIQTDGSSFFSQHRLKHKTGKYVWCEGTLTNMLHEPHVNAIVSNFRDISKRKVAEQLIIENEREIRDLAESMPQIVWITTANGGIIFLNQQWTDYTGLTREESMGDGWLIPYHEADREYARQEWNNAVNLLTEYSVECRLRKNDGSYRWWLIRGVPKISENGEIVKWHGTCTDIEKIKEKELQILKSESFNHNLINSITAHIAVVDEHGIIVTVNNAWEQFSVMNGDLKIERTGKGSNYFKECEEAVLRGDDLAGLVLQGMKDVMYDKQNVFYIEYPCHSPKEKRWFGLRIMKFEGNERLIITLHTDITEIKKAEEVRAKMTNDIIQRNKNLEQFSYIVSHNLRAPVANILGFSELLKYKDSNPGFIADSLKGMATAAHNLDGVIKDMSEILSVNTLLTENKVEIQFQDLVDGIALSIDNIMKKEDVLILTDFSSIDKMQSVKSYLYSIFFNLIINSIKFHRPNLRPIIEIKSLQVPNGIQLVFKDNGLGIDLKKHGENFFGLYKRFHLHVEGKGMGLFMMKTQAEALGGKISIVSEVNKGTEFTIEFETVDKGKSEFD